MRTNESKKLKNFFFLLVIFSFSVSSFAQIQQKNDSAAKADSVARLKRKNRPHNYGLDIVRPIPYYKRFKIGDHVKWKSSDKILTGTILYPENQNICTIRIDNDTATAEVLYRVLQHIPNTPSKK